MSKQASTETEITEKFWKALDSDRTFMLSLANADEGHSRPMTAMLDGKPKDGGPIYIFSSKDTDLVRSIEGRERAVAHFASKDHELFAAVHGDISLDNDRAVIDRLWNPFIAAWFEGGKDDPNLQLLRFDAEHGKVWLNENNLLAGVKLLLGRDPKKDYKDKVAEVRLN